MLVLPSSRQSGGVYAMRTCAGAAMQAAATRVPSCTRLLALRVEPQGLHLAPERERIVHHHDAAARRLRELPLLHHLDDALLERRAAEVVLAHLDLGHDTLRVDGPLHRQLAGDAGLLARSGAQAVADVLLAGAH